MLFCFAGSSHPKYVHYLLETIVDFELESSPAYQRYFLRNLLVNPSGAPGRFQEGDLTQEHYNKELETYIARKDAQWDSDFLRKVISPNVHHFTMLKNQWGEGVGLKRRQSGHTEPHSKPEVRTLLQIYKEDLHRFRAGRHYSNTNQDNDMYTKGITALYSKLPKWIIETTRTRPDPETPQAHSESQSNVHSGTEGSAAPRVNAHEMNETEETNDAEELNPESPQETSSVEDVRDIQMSLHYAHHPLPWPRPETQHWICAPLYALQSLACARYAYPRKCVGEAQWSPKVVADKVPRNRMGPRQVQGPLRSSRYRMLK